MMIEHSPLSHNRMREVGPVVAVGIIVALGFVHWPTEAALGY
jgi:hypothetical protein